MFVKHGEKQNTKAVQVIESLPVKNDSGMDIVTELLQEYDYSKVIGALVLIDQGRSVTEISKALDMPFSVILTLSKVSTNKDIDRIYRHLTVHITEHLSSKHSLLLGSLISELFTRDLKTIKTESLFNIIDKIIVTNRLLTNKSTSNIAILGRVQQALSMSPPGSTG